MSLLLTLLLQAGTVVPPPPAAMPNSSDTKASDKARKVEPSGNPGSWITTGDYPADALRKQQEGTSNLTVAVDTQGKIESCTAVGPFESLNVAACTLIRERAQFSPALDAKGRPVKSVWTRSVRWRIPPNNNNNLHSPIDVLRTMKVGLTTTITMIIEKDGSISSCEDITEIDGKQQNATGPCYQMPAKVEPLLDADGKPSRERIELRTEMTRKALQQ